MKKATMKILNALSSATAHREVLLKLATDHVQGDRTAAPKARSPHYMEREITKVFAVKLKVCKKNWKATPSAERFVLTKNLVKLTKVANAGAEAARKTLSTGIGLLRSDYLKSKTEGRHSV